MSDSWPAPPPGDDASDSLAGQALEVERALKALEAVDAFRAEAAALRAELQAVRASGTLAGRGPRRRAALRRAPGVPEGAWRLAAECAVIIGAAVVAWAVHLGRVGILLTLGGTWLVVAVFEAVASRRPQATWIPPPAPVSLPPVRAVSSPPHPIPKPAAPELSEPIVAGEVGWPSRLEQVEAPPEPALEVEPEPEAEAEAEPVLLFPEVEPDGGPSAGAFTVLEEAAELLDEGPRRRRWWPRFGRREKLKAEEPDLLEPESLVQEPQPEPIEPPEEKAEVDPDGGPSAGAFAVLEEGAQPGDEEAPEQPRRRWLLFDRRVTPDVVFESERLVQEPESGSIVYPEHQPESEADLVSPAPAAPEPEHGWPSRPGPRELLRQPELEAEHELLVEPEEPEELEETDGGSELGVEPEAELVDEPAAGAFAVLEDASEPSDQEAALPQRRWRFFGSRETAGLLDSEPLDEEPEPEPIDDPEHEPQGVDDLASPAPPPPDTEYGWPSRGPSELLRKPEPAAEQELLVEPEAPEELEETEAGSSLVLELEPQQESVPEPEPEPLYAFSPVEPDGGPCVGAVNLLEELAVLREQPMVEPPLPPRRGLLLLRRRRARA
jgi:hypothetical protein